VTVRLCAASDPRDNPLSAVVLEHTDTAEASSRSPASGEAASAPDVTLRGIRKSYGDVVAVDAVDLEVARVS
jgi:hypothetical protein